MSQSNGLSERLTQMVQDGHQLNDDSAPSERTLTEAMEEVIPYAKELFSQIEFTIVHKKTITLYDCQVFFERVGGPVPNPDNKTVSMKPDGGILFAESGEKSIPILIVEDKVQGTNDNLFKLGKKKQATGNAIERGGKNIRGAEMIFSSSKVFPYVLFASGCDFHSTETIAKRIEMMNMGVPNHYIDIEPTTTEEQIQKKIEDITEHINIDKLCCIGIASVFVKAHKWDKMAHESSSWKKSERVLILKKVLDKVFETFNP
jgi:type II restriction enzyme